MKVHDRRIIKSLELEETFKVYLVQLLRNEQGHLPLKKGCSEPGPAWLWMSLRTVSTTNLGNLFQLLTTLTVKNFFLISNLSLHFFSL